MRGFPGCFRAAWQGSGVFVIAAQGSFLLFCSPVCLVVSGCDSLSNKTNGYYFVWGGAVLKRWRTVRVKQREPFGLNSVNRSPTFTTHNSRAPWALSGHDWSKYLHHCFAYAYFSGLIGSYLRQRSIVNSWSSNDVIRRQVNLLCYLTQWLAQVMAWCDRKKILIYKIKDRYFLSTCECRKTSLIISKYRFR